MTARLVHQLWMSRNGAPRDQMPPEAWAVVEAQTPEAREPPITRPLWTQIAFACFWDCSTERAIGFGGVGPIPYRAIVTWADRNVPRQHHRTLIDVVRRMDAKYLQIEAARAEAERK